MRVDLSSLLQEIDIPASEQGNDLRYFVKPIPNFERHYFGRTGAGAPSLLLSANDQSPKAPIRLAAVEVRFSVPCKYCRCRRPNNIRDLNSNFMHGRRSYLARLLRSRLRNPSLYCRSLPMLGADRRSGPTTGRPLPETLRSAEANRNRSLWGTFRHLLRQVSRSCCAGMEKYYG